MTKILFAVVLIAGIALGTFAQSAATSAAAAADGAAFTKLAFATVLVRDYDEALKWYVNVLGFVKVRDQSFGAGHRWVVVAPKDQREIGIVLAVPQKLRPNDATRDYMDRVGKETNWVFQATDVRKLYERLSRKGVKFLEPPTDQPWGAVQAIFEDLYGNIFVVESPRAAAKGEAGGPGSK